MTLVIADRVKETSTSAGVGAFSLAGALLGYRSFGAVCVVGDTAHYCIQAVDGAGAAAAQWEVGVGTYTAIDTLMRDTVIASSSGAFVDFSAGGKQVFITASSEQLGWVREKMAFSLVLHVSPAGSSDNDGRTPEKPFRLIQEALDAAARYDYHPGAGASIMLAAGTYTNGAFFQGLTGTGGYIEIVGDETTPANVVISLEDSVCLTAYGRKTDLSVKGVTLSGDTGLHATYGASIVFANVVFGACASQHIMCEGNGSAVYCSSPYSITGNSRYHIAVDMRGVVDMTWSDCTLVGSRSFSTSFCKASGGSYIRFTNSARTGTATGKQYSVTQAACIEGGATLPGDIAGTTATNGLYF